MLSAPRSFLTRLVGLAVILLLGSSLVAEAQFQTYFGKNKISYRSFDWKVYHSPHFDLYYYESEADQLQRVVSLAESAYDRISRRLDYQIQKPTPLIVYATHSAFQQNNIIFNFIPEGVGAFATPTRYRMVLPMDLSDEELFDLVMHELTHIFQYYIFYQGSLGKAIANSTPLWLTEGMASYVADDETSWDRMPLRDAVVNDLIPRVSRMNSGGFFAYRFGHSVYDFIEDRWGQDGLLDFIYEYRNTLGGRVDRAVERAFKLDGEDFDAEFRRWLRRKYLPALVDTGEPADFGHPFRARQRRPALTSAISSPGGDLLALLTTDRGELDVAIYDSRRREPISNITKGFTSDYQFLVGQFLTVRRDMGRDLAFSPNGNQVAAFAKREAGRDLVIFDVLEKRRARTIEMFELGIEQQTSPAWSPDGRSIVFSGWKEGQFDIFQYYLESGDLTNLTEDDVFDGAPTFSPDGKSVVFSTVAGGFQKLYRIDLADPAKRWPLTQGDSNDRDAVYSRDGKTIYFTSDRRGADNIYSLDLETGRIDQWTNAVTGCFMPTLIVGEDGEEKLVYTGFWRQNYELYISDRDKPIETVETTPIPTEAATSPELPRFEPDIEVALDEGNFSGYTGFKKLAIEGADSYIGVDDAGTLVGRIRLSFTDYLGDRRLLLDMATVSSFSNFRLTYGNYAKRKNWEVSLYDEQAFFVGQSSLDGRPVRLDSAFRQTGITGKLIFPFSLYTRGEVGTGYVFRDADFQSFVFSPALNDLVPTILPRTDDFPVVIGALVGDSTVFSSFGPVAGRRWRLDAMWGPDIGDGGNTLTSEVTLDFRQYLPLSRRTGLAFRAFGGISDGEFPSQFYFGGFDTLRGFRFRELVGDRAFYTNAEFRFPIIDALDLPFISFRNIRGLVFVDVGGAWFKDFQDFDFLDGSRLQDGVSSYGFGFTVQLFGLDLNWDIAKTWDLQDTTGNARTSFWIGTRF